MLTTIGPTPDRRLDPQLFRVWVWGFGSRGSGVSEQCVRRLANFVKGLGFKDLGFKGLGFGV